MKKIFGCLYICLTFVLATHAQSFVLIPTEIKDMITEENVGEKQSKFIISGNTQVSECPDKFWDVLFRISSAQATDGDTAQIVLVSGGQRHVVAGFTFSQGKVIYTDWFSRAQVYYEGDQYNHWVAGQVVDTSRRLFMSFAMYGDNPWNTCAGMEVISTGLKIDIVSLVTVANSMCSCNPVIPMPMCATICMRTPFWWSNSRDLSSYTVAQFGMNFGNEIRANTPVVVQNLRNGSANGQAAAFQLQFQRQQVPPQNAGTPKCYGVTFENTTLADGTVVTVETQMVEINRLVKHSIRQNNAVDFNKLVSIITILNNVRNCGQ